MESRSEPPGLRYELKFACDAEAEPVLRMALRLDRSAIRTAYPPRRVQSIYLDTPAQRALEENLGGLSVREKIRFRWYGDDSRTVLGTLERKGREDTLGWKELQRVAGPTPLEDAPRREFMLALARGSSPAWAERLAVLEPVQWIEYMRDYLVTFDQRVRVTIDRGIRAYDQRRLMRLSRREPTFLPRIVVIEVKCAADDLHLAREIVGRLPVPLGRSSKFVMASEPSSGPVPSVLEV